MTHLPAYRFWGHSKPPRDAAIRCQAVPRLSEDATKATIRLYGPIDSWGGFWGTSAKEVAEALDGLADSVTEIQLRISSPGGMAFEGMTILNLFRAHPANVVAVVDGLAASAASIIAVGADELVMSPGSELMIHDPWSSAWGCNAAEMRKEAEALDKLGDSLASIYAEAGGGTTSTWRAAMQEETWYTAAEAVEAKLAARVAVVPDAGQVVTAGDDADPELDDDEPFDLSIFTYSGRDHAPAPAAHAAAPNPPAASAGGSTPSGKESAVPFSDEQITQLRNKLGVAEDADEATILAALDEVLVEQTEDSATLPEGMAAIEADVLAQLRADAQAGREARQQQRTEARDRAITEAVNDGRITPARRDHWQSSWDADPEGTAQLLAGLEKGLVPMEEAGHAGTADAEDDSWFAGYSTPTTKEA